MHPPVDYPIIDEAESASPLCEELTYAALLDLHSAEKIITEAMIQSACVRMEAAQQFPFACKPEPQVFTELAHSSHTDDRFGSDKLDSTFNKLSTTKPNSTLQPMARELNAITQPAAKALSRWISIIS